jgi:phage tail sheath protein FI
VSGDLSALDNTAMEVSLGSGNAMVGAAGSDVGKATIAAAPADRPGLAQDLQDALQGLKDPATNAKVLPSATVVLDATKTRLVFSSGVPGKILWFTGDLATKLGLDSADSPDVSGVDLNGLVGPEMDVWLGTSLGPVALTRAPASLTELASMLQAKLGRAQVAVIKGQGTQELQISLATPEPSTRLVFRDVGGTLATDLKLTDAEGAAANVQRYALGGGRDGGAPDAGALTGDSLPPKTGIYALDDVEFNILCLPDVTSLDDAAAFAVITEATTYCVGRLAFLLVDPPQGVVSGQQGQRDSLVGIQDWLTANSTLRTSFAALYFPRPLIPDPLNGYKLRSVAASGTIAGLYARTDANRGVWKAPAGTEAALTNVAALAYKLTDAENGVLNPLGINCLRSFATYGNVCWGARTLDGADAITSEWKYVPVRRTALYIEASLYRGTQWVVFEPNDEPVWAQIRLNVGAFMRQLFQQGAFQGSTPAQAYFVKCDGGTTTQADIDLGVVNILVGFAPLEPAEFVVLQIQQLAGQIPT